MNASELLPAIRDLYSRNPEWVDLEPWELVIILYSMRYTNELEDEGEVAAAASVARSDWTGRAA